MKKIAYVLAFLMIFICGCGLASGTATQQETRQTVQPIPPASAQKTPQASVQAPTGSSSQLGMISHGGTGMYNFFCFDGCIYEFDGDSQGMILAYDPSEVSAKPIGNTYNLLIPDAAYMFPVYSVNNVRNAEGAHGAQSIAIQEYGQYYCRADYFMKDTVTYKNDNFLIAPVSIAGDLDPEKFAPYQTDKKIGKTDEGFEVYSLKNPEKQDELAVDIPVMMCDIGLGKLYPLAIKQD